MGRLKDITGFLVLALGLFAALRVLHVALPIFYPQMLTGPFRVESPAAAHGYLGFAPRLPFYRPQQLGPRPLDVTVARRPHPEIVILWKAERFLRLTERKGGDPPMIAATGQSLPGHPDAVVWGDRHTRRVVLKIDDLWIELDTDLSERDVLRLIDTLKPDETLL